MVSNETMKLISEFADDNLPKEETFIFITVPRNGSAGVNRYSSGFPPEVMFEAIRRFLTEYEEGGIHITENMN